jgi:hypothetical protein
VPDRGLLERDRLHVPAALHLLLATSLFDDVAAVRRSTSTVRQRLMSTAEPSRVSCILP